MGSSRGESIERLRTDVAHAVSIETSAAVPLLQDVIDRCSAFESSARPPERALASELRRRAQALLAQRSPEFAENLFRETYDGLSPVTDADALVTRLKTAVRVTGSYDNPMVRATLARLLEIARPPVVDTAKFSAICAALRDLPRPTDVAADLLEHVAAFPRLLAGRPARTSFAALLSESGHCTEADALFRRLGARQRRSVHPVG